MALSVRSCLDVCHRTDSDLPAACAVRFFDSSRSQDLSSSREIRSFDVFHQTFDGDVVVFHVGLDRIHNLTQVVRRNACCHTDSDTVCAIQQKVRHAHRQNRRLFFRLVEVRYEIDNVFVEIL